MVQSSVCPGFALISLHKLSGLPSILYFGRSGNHVCYPHMVPPSDKSSVKFRNFMICNLLCRTNVKRFRSGNVLWLFLLLKPQKTVFTEYSLLGCKSSSIYFLLWVGKVLKWKVVTGVIWPRVLSPSFTICPMMGIIRHWWFFTQKVELMDSILMPQNMITCFRCP